MLSLAVGVLGGALAGALVGVTVIGLARTHPLEIVPDPPATV